MGNNTPGVAVHTNGEVFACSRDRFVQVFSENGTAVRRIGSKGNGNGQFGYPWGLLLVGDRLYVFGCDFNCVQYFSATTVSILVNLVAMVMDMHNSLNSKGMSTDGKGNILVAEFSNNRVS